jgi:hypothetical protein
MLAPTAPTESYSRLDYVRLPIVLAGTLIVSILLCTHTGDINGPWYWKWQWQRIPLTRYWPMLLAALPFAAAQWLRAKRAVAPVLLIFCALQLRLTSTLIQDDHFGLGQLAAVVRSPTIVSYYSDAGAIGQDPSWLADYPQILPLTSLHTCSKPPGPVAYYLAWIRLLGYGDRSAMAAGLGVLALQTLVVPLVYLLASALLRDREAAFAAASFICLCPGAVLIVPMLDPLYAAWTCLILWSWHRTLCLGSARMSLVCGALAAAGLFCSYSLLTLAPFAAMQALLIARPARPLVMLPRLVLTFAAGFGAFYAILWVGSHFDPFATFHSAWTNQNRLLFQHRSERPYPATILFDLTDFALAMGWIGAMIAIMGFCRAAGERSMESSMRWLLAACILQPFVVAISGTLQSETLRVWNFMLPLMAIAAGFELAFWHPRARAMAYAAMFTVLLAIGRNLQLI